MKNNFSYLTINQSNGIKGVLMLLIILGHNHILVPLNSRLFTYLYEFHIYGFFILPFLYNSKYKQFNFKNIIDVVIRNWVPYIIFFVLCYFIYHFFILKDHFSFSDFSYGLFNGSSLATKKSAGFFFLWFMPAYATMSILMIAYKNLSVNFKYIIPLIGIILYLMPISNFAKLFLIIPFAILQGFYYFSFGFLTKFILEKIPKVEYIAIFNICCYFDFILVFKHR